MSTSAVARILCVTSIAIASLSHVTLSYVARPIPYPLVGLVGALSGIMGIIFRGMANRANPHEHISKLYVLAAVLGILIGLFYASMIGPLILFFPQI